MLSSLRLTLLKNKHSILLITLLLSLILHLLLVVNVGLPIKRFKGQKSNVLEVALVENSSNKKPVQEKPSQTIPDPIKENSSPSEIKTPPPTIKSPTNNSTSVPSKTEVIEKIAPQDAPKQNQIKTIETPQTSLLASDQLSVPATMVDIEFDMVYGTDGKIISSGQQHFTSDGAENYQVKAFKART
jgi:cytoskeletal protein RodZ